MPVLCLGISFRRAPLELLERLAFTDDDLTKAYRRASEDDAIREAVILSTCNRVEVYAAVPAYHAGFLALKRLLAEAREVGVDELAEPLYAHHERDAVAHLFAVAAGLDSMVIGESQIGSQVREALRRAEAEGAAGATLAKVFRSASRAGRRVRAETSLGSAPDAFVATGVDFAEEHLGRLAGRRVLVIGAGQMASLSVKHLRQRGAGPVRILNRSLERARALAERTSAEHGDLDSLAVSLASADLVISATGAAGTVVGAHTVRVAIADRGAGRPLVLVDLAVPRDVEPAVAAIDGVHLIDIAGLFPRIADETTAADIARAGEIVGEEVERHARRRRADDLAPLIKAVQSRGDEVVRSELRRFRARLSELTPDEREAVEALARAIVAKLLHDPIVRMKESEEPEVARLLADVLGTGSDPE